LNWKYFPSFARIVQSQPEKMNLAELKKLVREGEGQSLEFKKKADHPEKIVREMVAFANSGGGTLLLGVDDFGRISGLSFPEEERYVMEAAMHKYARPEFSCEPEQIPVGGGKWVLLYQIPDGKEKPYYWLEDPRNMVFRVFVRARDQTLKASYEVFRILRQKAVLRPVTIGETERHLFAALENGQKISIGEFAQQSGLSRKKVSNLFIKLAGCGVMVVQPGNGVDLFGLSDAYMSGDG
jgi:hypothetical protein